MQLPTTGTDESQSARPVAASLFERLQYPLATVLLLLFLALGWVTRTPAMRAAGDDEFKYLALSKSLESGSYRDTYRAAAPLHVQYPPAYPAWLVAARNVLGETFDRIRVANLALAALALLIWFKIAQRLVGTPFALALLTLLALNPGLLTLSASLASEGLFLLCSTLTVALMVLEPRSERLAIAGVIGFALLAFLTRSLGLPAVIAAGTWLWLRKRTRPLLAWAVASLVVVGGWTAYTFLARADDTVRSYASSFLVMTNRPEGPVNLLVTRVWEHGVEYFTTDLPYLLSLPTLHGTLVDNWIWLVVMAVLLSLGTWILWQRWRPALVYVILSGLLILVWPFRSGRLFVPLLPFGLLGLLLGARWLTSYLASPARKIVQLSFAALLITGAARGAWGLRRDLKECDRANPYSSPGCYDPVRLAIFAAASYVRQHAPPGQVVIAREPATFSYFSSHPVEPPLLLLAETSDQAMERLRARNVQMIFVSLPWMARALEPKCHELRLEATFPSGAALVSLAAPDSAASACPPLAQLSSKLPPVVP